MKKLQLLLTSLLVTLFTSSQVGQTNQVNIVSFTVKNVLPADVNSWMSTPAALILVAQKVSSSVPMREPRLVIQIRSGGTIICGNSIATARPVDPFDVRTFTTADLTGFLTNCHELKEGTYTICAQFFNVDKVAISREVCKEFKVEEAAVEYSPPTLITPDNGKKFTEKELQSVVMFRWTPLVPKPKEPVTYRLRVWQLMQGQNGTQAMQVNQPVVSKDIENITQTVVSGILTGPCKPPFLCDFIWDVEALNKAGRPMGRNNGTSEPAMFFASVKEPEKPGMIAIKLVSPSDGETIAIHVRVVQDEMPAGLVFMWTTVTPSPKEGYTLKLVELKANQSAQEAMKNNTPLLKQENIKSTSFQYPASAAKLEGGRKYAWQINGGPGGMDDISEPITFSIKILTEQKITLIQPGDGETIAGIQNMKFTWLPPVPDSKGIKYTLKIVEVIGRQSSTEAMNNKEALFEKAGIEQTTFQYSAKEKKSDKMKRFAWRVIAMRDGQEIGQSNPGNFTLSSCGTLNITPSLQCAGGDMYNFTLSCLNAADPGTDPNCVLVVTSVTLVSSIAPVNVSTTLPLSIQPGQTGTISGQFGPTTTPLSWLFFVSTTGGPNGSGTYAPSYTLPAPPSTPGSIAGSQTVCSGQAGLVYSISPVSGAASYAWTVPSGATITAGQGTQFITVTMGNASGNVCVSSVNTCGQSPQNCKAITVTAVPPTGAISGNLSPCQGSSQNYSVTNIGGITYTWTFPVGWTQTSGGSTNSVTVTVGTGSGNIKVTPSNTCGNGTAQTLAVTPITLPAQPGIITGNTTPCQGSSQNYSVPNVSGIIYTWTFPPGWTQTAGGTTNSATVTVGASAGAGNITLTPSNACGIGTARLLAVTPINVPVQPSVITGMAAICQGSSQNYSVINVSGVTYTWTFPSGWTQTAGGSSNSVTAIIGTGAGNITVTPSNSCGNGIARTLAVTPTISLPATPVAISGPASVCMGQAGVVYSTSAVSGATSYNWTVPAGVTINTGQGTPSISVTFGSVPGNVCVSGINNCGTGPNRCKAITFPTTPAAPVAGPGTGIQPTQFTANWSFILGASSYKLDLSTSSTFASYVPGYHDISIGTINTFSVTGLITGLSCNTTYYYRVRAVGACSGTSANSNVRMVTTSLTTIQTPTANAATGIQLTQFTANWTAVAGASGYYLDVATNSSFTSYVTGFNNKAVGTATSYTVTGLTNCQNYYYRVRAYTFCSGISTNSNTVTVVTALPVPHGSWTKGPGTYSFKVAAFGTTADINGCPGQSITITIETWGGGGGGGGGQSSRPNNGGAGGSGGGGGGYGKTTINVVVPSSGTDTYSVKVGSGGLAGQPLTSLSNSPYILEQGGLGGFSEVRRPGWYSLSLVLKSTGGIGGQWGYYATTAGGGGSGTINNWSGASGYNGGVVSGCNGGAGGLGGAGGGPGAIGNNGGNGGDGGYYNAGAWNLGGCTSQSQNNGQTPGVAGGNGKVVFTW